MRERDRLGAESRLLRLTADREFPEAEYENGKAAAVRKIILVAGLDYPRYDFDKKSKLWILRARRTAPDLHTDDHKGKLDNVTCLTAADRKLRADADVLTGSLWRMRGLRLAALKLHGDPDLQVYLYDLQKGVEERIRIDKGKLTAQKIRTFLPIVSGDYRRVVEVQTKDSKGAVTTKKVLRPVNEYSLAAKDHPHRPSIRYFPFVSTLAQGEVDYDRWIRDIAANSKWLGTYATLRDDKRVMSVADVYYHVHYIGRHVPYALHELHLFGHASSSALSENSGTAFANTDYVAIKGRPGRHPLDLDARASIDFAPPTIDPTVFRMAFAKGAMSFVWGCNWNRPLMDIIRQAGRALGTKALSDDVRIKFRWSDEGTSGPKDDFKKLLDATGQASNTIEQTGKFLRELLAAKVAATYMQRLADASGHCVSGGFPGVYSEYDDKPEKGAPCLLHIPMGKLYATAKIDPKTKKPEPLIDLRSILLFYEKKMGRSFNRDGAHPSFGRGFGLYCPRP